MAHFRFFFAAWLVLILGASGALMAQGWLEAPDNVDIPKSWVEGEVFESDWSFSKARVRGDRLQLSGEDASGDRVRLSITLPSQWGGEVAGQTLSVNPEDIGSLLRLQSESFDTDFESGYSVRLNFSGVREDGNVLGKLYVALPSEQEGWVSGFFEAEQSAVSEAADAIGDAGGAVGGAMVGAAGDGLGAMSDAASEGFGELSEGMGELGDLGMNTDMPALSLGSIPLVPKILGVVGILMSLLGSLWFIIVSFKVHWGWGLACFFIPFAALVFLVKYFSDAWKPFALSIFGAIVAGVAAAMAGASMGMSGL